MGSCPSYVSQLEACSLKGVFIASMLFGESTKSHPNWEVMVALIKRQPTLKSVSIDKLNAKLPIFECSDCLLQSIRTTIANFSKFRKKHHIGSFVSPLPRDVVLVYLKSFSGCPARAKNERSDYFTAAAICQSHMLNTLRHRNQYGWVQSVAKWNHNWILVLRPRYDHAANKENNK